MAINMCITHFNSYWKWVTIDAAKQTIQNSHPPLLSHSTTTFYNALQPL